MADLAVDGTYGFKLFLDDGTGVAQIFIDADSGVRVDKIRNRLLVEGKDLCVTGVVGQFAGVGFTGYRVLLEPAQARTPSVATRRAFGPHACPVSTRASHTPAATKARYSECLGLRRMS